MKTHGAGILTIAALIVAGCLNAQCRDTPVYRYALEHWEPDTYELMIFHDAKAPSTIAPALAALARATNIAPANLTVTLVDADPDTNAAASPLPIGTPPPAIPGAALGYPAKTQPGQAAWEGRATAETFNTLVDSPARRELIERLAVGDKPAWVLIESNKATDNEQALRELKAQNIDPIRVRRDDPSEQVFIAILLHSEPNPARYEGQPLVFPVFGRGRVLNTIAGEKISAYNLAAAIHYMTNPCTHEVKDENPGTDMLLTADWGKLLQQQPSLTTIPPKPAVMVKTDAPETGISHGKVETVHPNVKTKPAIPAPNHTEILTITLAALVIISLVIVATIAYMVFFRRR